MDRTRRLVAVAGFVVALFATTSAATAASSLGHFGHFTCRGGSLGSPRILKSGSYRSLRVVGVCAVPTGGTVRVRGNVLVERHATLNAVSQSTFNVGGNVVVSDDAIAGLGCSDEAGCANLTNDHIGGNLTANGATAVVVQQEFIGGNATIVGGGGNMNCASTAFFGGPYFDTIEDSSVAGNIWIQRVHSCWFGMFRLHVGGNVSVRGNRMADPDGNEIATNTIGGNLACFNNVPHAQVGDSQGAPNVVAGKKLGECASL
jgi:hypothetical protein